MAEPAGKLGEDPQLGARFARRLNCLAPANDAPFKVSHRAVFFRPLGDGQDDVGNGDSFGGDHVGHNEQVKAGQRRSHSVGIGRGHEGVGTMDEQRFRTSRRAERRKQLNCGHTRARQRLGPHVPDLRHVCAACRVSDRRVAGQLIAFLAVLATPLPVSLARNGAVAGTDAAHESKSKSEIDCGGDGVGAMGGLLEAPAGENVRTRAAA